MRADLWFTTPAVIVQPLTGLAMVHLAGWPLNTPWLMASIALYLFAGACWLPVVWLQLRMKALAEEALRIHANVCSNTQPPPTKNETVCCAESEARGPQQLGHQGVGEVNERRH